MKLKCSPLKSIKVLWITVDMIMDYKSFLRMNYVPSSKDVNENLKFSKTSWLNFGFGEITDTEEKLKLRHHHGTVFGQFKMDTNDRGGASSSGMGPTLTENTDTEMRKSLPSTSVVPNPATRYPTFPLNSFS